jgi:hypothetical protein
MDATERPAGIRWENSETRLLTATPLKRETPRGRDPARQRIAFGFRNCDHQRRQFWFHCTRQSRRNVIVERDTVPFNFEEPVVAASSGLWQCRPAVIRLVADRVRLPPDEYSVRSNRVTPSDRWRLRRGPLFRTVHEDDTL